VAIASDPIEQELSHDGTRERLVGLVQFLSSHWLAGANLALIVFSTLPVLAPVLANFGADGLSLAIFQLYSFTCHQMPSRSYFILGYQMAYCERNTAIYFAMTAAGLAYVALRNRGLRPLPIRWYLVLILPMAIDGFTQLFGLRESTWWLRGITGSLFGVATVWLTFPRLQESFDELESEL
jgi:uncharacterized membrane protein